MLMSIVNGRIDKKVMIPGRMDKCSYSFVCVCGYLSVIQHTASSFSVYIICMYRPSRTLLTINTCTSNGIDNPTIFDEYLSMSQPFQCSTSD